MVHWGSRAFVTAVFVILGAAFVAETASLIYEFYEGGQWFTLAAFDSQNFIFFPTAGIAVLIAFWRPATVAVDSYARGRVVLGRFILPAGLVGCVIGAHFLAGVLGGGENRSLYEIAPAQYAADMGERGARNFADNAGETAPVWRMPPRSSISEAVEQISQQSSAGGLTFFTDTCRTETQQFVQVVTDEKYCFVSGAYLTVAECCAVRGRFRAAINAMHAEEESLTAKVHRVVMPMKIFFLLILVGIGIMLVRRRKEMARYYREEMDAFSLALPVGAGMMMLWPLLNSAYTLSYDVAFGDAGGGLYRQMADLYTLAFAAWALMMLFYHLRNYPGQLEALAQIGGLIGAGVGVLSYGAIVDFLNRTLGVGANVVSLSVWIVGVVFMVYIFSAREDEDTAAERARAEERRAASAT
ncbi:MAG: hypothetical protein MI723_08170 [Caulobacterales bacterium]|nr:hypothetical protein [Caulobacterales bacterium]